MGSLNKDYGLVNGCGDQQKAKKKEKSYSILKIYVKPFSRVTPSEILIISMASVVIVRGIATTPASSMIPVITPFPTIIIIPFSPVLPVPVPIIIIMVSASQNKLPSSTSYMVILIV